ncbi:MAG: CapA family protein [Lachnospiraceae bacterium]|nr:CapA family protein [Lachnospiraceae bacterium]
MKKKKKRFPKQLKIFLITLAVVLVMGTMLLLARRAAKTREAEQKETGTVSVAPDVDTADVVALPTDDPVTNASAETTGSAAAAPTTVELVPASDAIPTGTEEGSEDAAVPTEAVTEEIPGAVALGSGISAEHIYTVDTAEEGKITFAFAGDILFDPGYAIYSKYRQNGCVLENCISPDLLGRMRDADVCIVNNEFPYSKGGSPCEGKTYTFRADPSSVEILKNMGVDIAGVANNHAFDYGLQAFEDTLTTLADANIPYAGGGRNLEEAKKPIYVLAGGMKIGIVCATQIERYNSPHSKAATDTQAGLLRSFPDINMTLDAIRTAEANSDFVILLIHWGTELEVEPDWAQNEQLPKFLEAGADAVIGAHPHILQQVAYKSGVPVVYSMGNFWFNSKTLDTCLIELTLAGGSIESLRFVPCLQTNSTVKMLHDGEAKRVLEYMRSISPSVNIDGDGFITSK